MREAGAILVRAPSWIGDAVAALPLFEALAQAHPGAPIIALARESTKEIVASSPAVRYVLVEPRVTGLTALPALAGLRRRLRQEHVQSAVLLSESVVPLGVIRASGVGRAFRLGRTARRGWLTVVERRPGHLYDQYAALARAAGAASATWEPRITVTPADGERARALLHESRVPAERVTLLACGASFGSAKAWPRESFAAVARDLAAHGAHVVLVGSLAERPDADWIIAAAGDGVSSVVGRTDVRTLAALCAEADQLIGNDSGAVHVASAVGAHTIGVYGSTDPEWTAPRSPRHVSVMDQPRCAPCFQRRCAFGAPCLTRVRPDAVLERARERIGAREREQREDDATWNH